jgi:hypothetical protein
VAGNVELPPDVWLNTPEGRIGYVLSDPRQARKFFDDFVVGPYGQTLGWFKQKDGSHLQIKDMTDKELVSYSHLCMRTILGLENH